MIKYINLAIFICIPHILNAHSIYGPEADSKKECFTATGGNFTKEVCISPEKAWAQRASKFIELQISSFFPQDYKMCGDTSPKERFKRFQQAEKAYLDYLKTSCELLSSPEIGKGDDYINQCIESKWIDRQKNNLSNFDSGHYHIRDCLYLGGSGEKTVLLKTDNYTVELTKLCNDTFFMCQSMTYKGTRNSDGSEIRLTGKSLLDENKNHIGFLFIRGNYRYEVYFSGELKVLNNKNNDILLTEQGQWYRHIN